ncbi:hypothetical protein LCGC14_0349920 [marine sediment metagenome]|uniref:Uncharacterized protein n=1 Tax=marine sediment metagenome TaxID=412755 RepID=A0A0F9TB53_9ZZZZ
MTREEIREGIRGLLYALENNRDLLDKHNQSEEFSFKIVEYLHSQGVVIKVEEHNIYTGYWIVKPLIEKE